MDKDLKREIILENYQNPKNKGLVDDKSYLEINMDSESCIDNITVQLKIEDGKIVDAHFDGEACAICTSSASIMLETLIGKDIKEVEKIIESFENMIDEKDYDSEILELALVYDDISKQANRKKCALLPWWGVKKLLSKGDL